MEKITPSTTTPTTTPTTAPTTNHSTTTTTPTPAPVTTKTSEEELCGSVNILDTVHLKNLVDDLAKLYGTSVCTKVAKDTKVAAEKRLIQAIRANLDRYEG